MREVWTYTLFYVQMSLNEDEKKIFLFLFVEDQLPLMLGDLTADDDTPITA